MMNRNRPKGGHVENRGLLKICGAVESSNGGESANEGVCLRCMMNRNRPMGGGGSPNKGACLRCMMTRNRQTRGRVTNICVMLYPPLHFLASHNKSHIHQFTISPFLSPIWSGQFTISPFLSPIWSGQFTISPFLSPIWSGQFTISPFLSPIWSGQFTISPFHHSFPPYGQASSPFHHFTIPFPHMVRANW